MFVPLLGPRFRAQNCVAAEAIPHPLRCFLGLRRLRSSGDWRRLWTLNWGTDRAHGCFTRKSMTDEARVKTQLEKLRTIAEVRLRSGTVPDWSWPQHVQLIEAVDAMLHDISVAENAHHAKRYTGGPLRLVTDNPERPVVPRKTGSIH